DVDLAPLLPRVAADAISPAADDAVGAIGVSDEYAREDHKHPAQGISADAVNQLSVGTDGLHFYGGSNIVFITNTGTAPATAGSPTDAEALAAAGGGATRDVFVRYTGTDVVADPNTYVWFIDDLGAITRIQEPSEFADAISPAASDATGAVGVVAQAAREDHQHPAQAVSADAEQLLKAGADGLHMLDPDDLISADANNTLVKGTDAKLYASTGQTRLHATNTAVAPATASEPTVAEIQAWATANTVVSRLVYYTASDTATDDPTKVYHVDSAGVVTLVNDVIANAGITGSSGVVEWSDESPNGTNATVDNTIDSVSGAVTQVGNDIRLPANTTFQITLNYSISAATNGGLAQVHNVTTATDLTPYLTTGTGLTASDNERRYILTTGGAAEDIDIFSRSNGTGFANFSNVVMLIQVIQ
ncbi:MAG: hypothetical protein AB8B85_05495, partial [Paracoccaceae bacterium]